MINQEKDPLDLENIKISYLGENILLTIKDKTEIVLNKEEVNRLIELLFMAKAMSQLHPF